MTIKHKKTEINTELEEKSVDAVITFVKDRAEELVKPTSQILGKNISILVDGLSGYFALWGEKMKEHQKLNLEQFKVKIQRKINEIPEIDLKQPEMKIIGPAIETSKYFFEEEYYQEMFSALIASSCDNRKTNLIHPSYVDIIKQLSPLDSKILKSLYQYRYSNFPILKIGVVSGESSAKLPIYLLGLDNDLECNLINFSSSIDNLIRLGILNIEPHSLQDFLYNTIKRSDGYKRLYNEFTGKLNINNVCEFKFSGEISIFGNNFMKICIDKNNI